MRRSSPPYHSSPRRGYGRGRRSPAKRGYGGGRRREQNHGSLLVRNIPLDCRSEELRVPFERFGTVRDVYMPKDYYTGKPRGFAFVQFVDPYNASEAQYHMNGKIFARREISVVFAAETRKRPEEMRQKSRIRGPVGNDGRRSSYYGRSRSRSVSRSRSPHHHSRHSARSFSPAPRRRSGYSVSPKRQTEHPRSPRGSNYSVSPRRQAEHPRSPRVSDYSVSPRRQAGHPRSPRGSDYSVSPRRQGEHPGSPRGPPRERDGDPKQRSYSPGYDNDFDYGKSNGYGEKKSMYKSETAGGHWRRLPCSASRSPVGSRSRSADLSPRHGR